MVAPRGYPVSGCLSEARVWLSRLLKQLEARFALITRSHKLGEDVSRDRLSGTYFDRKNSILMNLSDLQSSNFLNLVIDQKYLLFNNSQKASLLTARDFEKSRSAHQTRIFMVPYNALYWFAVSYLVLFVWYDMISLCYFCKRAVGQKKLNAARPGMSRVRP